MPWAERSPSDIDDLLMPLGKIFVEFFIWAVGLMVAVNSAGVIVSTILASLGIGGLTFALAAQGMIANIFEGITVFLQKSFKVGDRIEVSGINGWVREIGLRSSMIQDFFGNKISVPNRTFTTAPLTNIAARPSYLIKIPLRLNHENFSAQLESALEILKDIVKGHELIEDRSMVHFDMIGDYSFDVELFYHIRKWKPIEQETIGTELGEFSRQNRSQFGNHASV